MAIGANLERRGAVYYWRKRLPKGLALRIGTNHVRLSLRTREVREARYLAASLNARAAHVLMNDTPQIGRDQLETIFRATFEAHRRKLALLADFARGEQGFNPEADTADETAMGWAYRLFARKGLNATLDETDRHSFRQAGIDPEAMTLLEATVERMKSNGEAKPSKARLAEAIQESGAELTAGTVAQAIPVYLRALGDALLLTEERYGSNRLDFGAVTEPARTRGVTSDAEDTHRPETGRQGLAEPVPITTPQEMTASSQPKPCAPLNNSDVAGATPGTASFDSVKAVGEKLINQKLGDGLWDDKTARQARMIFDLFERFLREEALITSLSDLCQAHLDAFDAFLRTLFKSYGKNPKDRQRSVAALRLESARRPETERGLSGATRNRHLTFLGQLLRRAKSAGIVIDAQLDLTDFRARKAKRGRDDRPVPARAQIEAFFHVPVFTGCREWNDIHRAGTQVFHRAAYFGPLLANYQGMRREEYCGLTIQDIVLDNGDHPYIHVCFNTIRRLKNLQSVRNLALHPELIRLNFLGYVDAIKQLGYGRLFPDLHSPSTRSPSGDRLYDELLPSFRQCEFTPHQSRHFFGNELKQKRVSAEFRADLLGHGGSSETTERYCSPSEIANQLADLGKLSVVTSHLASKPIRLVPWVEQKQIAPWSRLRMTVGRQRWSCPGAWCS